MKTIIILLTIVTLQSCLYEQYSKAIITNKTNEIITLTFHIDTTELDRRWHNRHPKDAFKNIPNEILTLDSTDNLIGKVKINPNQTLELDQSMTYQPMYWFDKISFTHSGKHIVIDNKTDIEKAFVKNDFTYEMKIQ